MYIRLLVKYFVHVSMLDARLRRKVIKLSRNKNGALRKCSRNLLLGVDFNIFLN